MNIHDQIILQVKINVKKNVMKIITVKGIRGVIQYVHWVEFHHLIYPKFRRLVWAPHGSAERKEYEEAEGLAKQPSTGYWWYPTPPHRGYRGETLVRRPWPPSAR